ncbi:MAG TPA: TetR/AcrR family transcriptional regulator [Polyangiaceae bacterium]|nr:TetR/AcrR family transcriptional regulator [Polyangiaceae bacterium]
MAAQPTANKARHQARPTRPGGRSARIVAGVLRATAEELARVGYAALRVEDVARAAKVNKTTVYRRWPTKMQLVTEALRRERERCIVTPDTGSVREDLRIMLHAFAEQGRTPLARAWLSELGNAEVRTIMRGFRHHVESEWVTVIARGMARGELSADISPLLLVEIVVAPVTGRLVRGEELPTDDFCAQVINLVLAGAVALGRAGRQEPEASTRRRGVARAIGATRRPPP